jgi:hypothetical protein
MKQTKALLASWGRSFLAAALAVYLTDTANPDLKQIGYAGLAAVLPVVIRYLNPKDSAFGVK